MSITKFWWHELSLRNDTLPCPHCLEPTWLSSPSITDQENDRAIECSCRNEKCPNFSCYIQLHTYIKEFKFVLNRVNDGYKYSKKVIKFAQEII